MPVASTVLNHSPVTEEEIVHLLAWFKEASVVRNQVNHNTMEKWVLEPMIENAEELKLD